MRIKNATRNDIFDYLYENKNNPLVKKVLMEDTTFTKEVENFYDLEFVGNNYLFNVGVYYCANFDEKKSLQRPSDLLKIMSDLTTKNWDTCDFNYSSVHKNKDLFFEGQYKKEKRKKFAANVLKYGSLAIVSLAGFAGSKILDSSLYKQISFVVGTLAPGIMFGLYFFDNYSKMFSENSVESVENKVEVENEVFRGFDILHKNAAILDSIVENNLRKKIVSDGLESYLKKGDCK